MKIDLHCHSKYSRDNNFEPLKLINEAVSKGLDGICLTEHDFVNASQPFEDFEKPKEFLILRAVEISTAMGHMLAFGLEDDSWNIWERDHYLDLEMAVEAVKEQGGICVPSHPFRGIESMGYHAFDKRLFDAVETINGANYQLHNSKAITCAAEAQMTGVGGSDCHGTGQIGKAYTFFERPIGTIQDLVNEIKMGRCNAVAA